MPRSIPTTGSGADDMVDLFERDSGAKVRTTFAAENISMFRRRRLVYQCDDVVARRSGVYFAGGATGTTVPTSGVHFSPTTRARPSFAFSAKGDRPTSQFIRNAE